MREILAKGLKVSIATAHVLKVMDLNQPFLLETSACSHDVGAILLQGIIL